MVVHARNSSVSEAKRRITASLIYIVTPCRPCPKLKKETSLPVVFRNGQPRGWLPAAGDFTWVALLSWSRMLLASCVPDPGCWALVASGSWFFPALLFQRG